VCIQAKRQAVQHEIDMRFFEVFADNGETKRVKLGGLYLATP